MNSKKVQNPDMYEGREPYVFISYSHRDQQKMLDVTAFLKNRNIRFWYDSGLHSGDDWNLVIAQHLEKAAVCLLLLSEASSKSIYVKNELNFALNHRIPIHTLILEAFDIPIDIEFMIGRIQQVVMEDGYEQKLFNALPPELIDLREESTEKEAAVYLHPLYKAGAKLLERQGSVFYSGVHSKLNYSVLIQRDVIKKADADKLMRSAGVASSLSHPLFIRLIDVQIDREFMWSYMYHHKIVFLDDYLKEKQVDEKTIEKWIGTIVDGMDYLLKKGYAISDFARGSIVVSDDKHIRILRLHNGYYGIFRLRQDNTQYYVENEIQEIAGLFYQLCTGEDPVLPFPMIKKSHVSEAFLRKANLIIQKATKEQGRVSYTSFRQMTDDLKSSKVSLKDRIFLSQREKKLEQYQKTKEANRLKFTADTDTSPDIFDQLPVISPEEAYGFDATVAAPYPQGKEEKARIRILIIASGQVLSFPKDSIVIGRGQECEACFTQRYLSRRHTRVTAGSDGTYVVTDLHSTNGTTCGPERRKLIPDEDVTLPAGSIICCGELELKLLPPHY